MNAHVRVPELTTVARRDDPLTALAAELAQTKRRMLRLGEKHVQERLEADEDRLHADELDRQLCEQRVALSALASHLPASTREGAMLQALLAMAIELPALSERLPLDFRGSPDGRDFRATSARLERLLYSIVYSTDDVSEDLRLLRDEMAPRGFHGIAQLKELDAAEPFQSAEA